MRHEFIYNGMNSRDYGLKISGEDTWTRPQPDVKRISVPGRNGDLIQLGNRYQNLDITYHCGIVKDLRTNFDAFNARLLSEPGYHRLEDSYHPEYYRLAVFESALDPDVKQRAFVGEVDIKFNCKPQLFLKSGEIEQTITNGGIIYNPTPYTASPTFRFHNIFRNAFSFILFQNGKQLLRKRNHSFGRSCFRQVCNPAEIPFFISSVVASFVHRKRSFREINICPSKCKQFSDTQTRIKTNHDPDKFPFFTR